MDKGQAIQHAVAQFWTARSKQAEKQGLFSGLRDTGNRGAVTGGKQFDGFLFLIRQALVEAGVMDTCIHVKRTALPGYYRPTKKWDLLVISGSNLIAAVELKSHVGPSFGNNFNNRIEEALGNAIDLKAAFDKGVYDRSSRPWLGWLMLLEEDEKSRSPVKVQEPHFDVFPEYTDSSYLLRYTQFCNRLVSDGLYDATCLITSNKTTGIKGEYSTPDSNIGISSFVDSLVEHTAKYLNG